MEDIKKSIRLWYAIKAYTVELFKEGKVGKKKKRKKKEFTDDFEEAWKIYEVPVQCGDCYMYYDPQKKDKCPNCGGTEWVGSR